MKKITFIAMAVLVLGTMGQAFAASTDTIACTVRLTGIFAVAVTEPGWDIGAVALGDPATAPSTFNFDVTGSNVLMVKLEIECTNGASGWAPGVAAGSDTFVVEAEHSPDDAVFVTTTKATLAAGVDKDTPTGTFTLSFTAPTDDTKGAEESQNFTITLTASKGV